jgi:hypothetical protein
METRIHQSFSHLDQEAAVSAQGEEKLFPMLYAEFSLYAATMALCDSAAGARRARSATCFRQRRVPTRH